MKSVVSHGLPDHTLYLHHPSQYLILELLKNVRYTLDNFLTESYKPVNTLANVVLPVSFFSSSYQVSGYPSEAFRKYLVTATYYRYISYAALQPAFSCHTVA